MRKGNFKQYLSVLFLFIMLLSGCGQTVSTDTQSASVVPGREEVSSAPVIESESTTSAIEYQTNIQSELTPTTSEPEVPIFEEYDIQLMALGDNLIHMGVVHTGKQPDGTRNYDFLFDNLSDFIEKADIKIINQETPFAGNELGFSGYPHFNSPTEIGDAIATAGFNVVLHASNHAADQGVEGIEHCISFWEKHSEVLMTGIHESSDSQDIPLLTVKDKTFAILNYTYGPNYSTVPEKISSRLNILCDINPDTRQLDYTTLNPQVLEDIRTADELADIVIVCPHWGTEYTTKPSSYQEKWAMQMTEAGADLIIGTHPHVVQPISQIEAENGNAALCYYSLGNYVSTQQRAECMLGGMAWVTFHVTENDISISLEKTGVIPLVCHYTPRPVRIQDIYLLEDYTEELASSHGIITYGNIPFALSDLTTLSNDVLGDWVISAKEVFGESSHTP